MATDLSSTVTVRAKALVGDQWIIQIRTPATADNTDTIVLDTVPALVALGISTIFNVLGNHTAGATTVVSTWADQTITLAGSITDKVVDLIVWCK